MKKHHLIIFHIFSILDYVQSVLLKSTHFSNQVLTFVLHSIRVNEKWIHAMGIIGRDTQKKTTLE